MNRIEKLANFTLISSILQRGYETYINIKSSLNTDISDNQQDYFPERQLHEYMSTLRERMWQ
ncbi:MAG: hypothetical protein COB13_001720 [OCS116 cluster bacterium]|uniref:Uncharacterized protein n=1 Tax=OCS116 cluster bacterium TaxID=2030921 RepID=A0A2A4YU10_9PROT|nr:hypothetical protein [OCS116 cluster bacterium]